MRPEACGAAIVVLEEAGPGARKAEQAQSVPGRRGVEDDVIVGRGGLIAREQAGKLIEAAISTVQAPESSSRMRLISCPEAVDRLSLRVISSCIHAELEVGRRAGAAERRWPMSLRSGCRAAASDALTCLKTIPP